MSDKQKPKNYDATLLRASGNIYAAYVSADKAGPIALDTAFNEALQLRKKAIKQAKIDDADA